RASNPSPLRVISRPCRFCPRTVACRGRGVSARNTGRLRQPSSWSSRPSVATTMGFVSTIFAFASLPEDMSMTQRRLEMPDRGAGQAHPVGGVHGSKHTRPKLLQLAVKDSNRLGRFLQDWLAVLNNGINHARKSKLEIRNWNRPELRPPDRALLALSCRSP